VNDLPKSVDWRTEGVTSKVKDQGQCGSCWAFAATAVVESHVAINSGKLFDLSNQQTAMCAPNPDECGGTGGCNGSTSELAFDYVAKSKGLYLNSEITYDSYFGKNLPCKETVASKKPSARVGGFVKLPENDYVSLMNAVATIGPIAISVDASKWSSYRGGIFNGCNQTKPDINHAVVLVGYGEENGTKYWIVRNSWGTSYGEDGHIRVLRTDSEETRCGIDTTPEHGSACKGDTDPINVCGTCGILYDSSYPTDAVAL